MKKIFLVRHAKSSWNDPAVQDIDRPLNKRGKRDAPFMGNLLKTRKITPSIFLTSPAKRALSTAKEFCKIMNYPKNKIRIAEDLYLADKEKILDVLQNLEEDIESVMIFAHNPGITDFLNLIGDCNIDNMPTCSVASLEFKGDSWKEIKKRSCNLVFFEYPKKYFKPEFL